MTTRRTITLAAGGLSLWAAMAPLQAEDPIHTFTDGSIWFGASAAGTGDVDGDGVPDWAIQGGDQVIVYSGQTGLVLATLLGPSDEDLGRDLEALGDVDLDGFPDLLVGVPRHRIQFTTDFEEAGAAHVFRAFGGNVLRTHLAQAPDEAFGRDLAALGDLDQDGYPDYAIAAMFADAGPQSGTNDGRVQLFSGFDGSLLHEIHGTVGSGIGSAVAAIGDLDQDGRSEFAIGAERDKDPSGAQTGAVRIYSGATFALQATLFGAAWNDRFGSEVESAGDVNGDSLPDLLVAAPSENGLVGTVRVFSGVGASLLRKVDGDGAGRLFGINIRGIGDADGDGKDDYFAAASSVPFTPQLGFAYARLYSGASGELLRPFEATDAYDLVGRGAAAAGDVDGDGLADLVVGRPRDLLFGSGAGTAEVRRGCGSKVFPYGAGCPGTGGFVPTLEIGPCVSPGLDTTLSIGLGLGGSTALVFVGAGQASVPLAGGCTFLLSQFHPVPITLPLSQGGPGGGGISAVLPVPAQIVPPLIVNLQAFVLDPGSLLGAAGTRGLSLHLD